MRLGPGSRLGRYEIISALGAGGTDRVLDPLRNDPRFRAIEQRVGY